MTGSGVASFMRDRSATVITVVSTWASLLSGKGSAVVAATSAVLCRVELTPEETWTISVIVTWVFGSIVTRLQTTDPSLSQPGPWLASAVSKVTPAGRVSVTTTPRASEGPLLLTVNV